VVARELAARGVAVRVHEAAPSRTDDARAAREQGLARVTVASHAGREGVVVDALLGTGARPGLSGSIAAAVDLIAARRAAGAAIVALDLPTGVDATSGRREHGVVADLTVSFGTAKRGHVLARGACGTIVVVDIGHGEFANLPDAAPELVDASFVAAHVPPIAAESHKGVRRRVAIVGGARGMAGAASLAGSAATRSGAGMVRLVVETASLSVVQVALPEATAVTWPAPTQDLVESVAQWAHAVLLGPGLGRSADAREVLVTLLEAWQGPTVLDADALNHFAGDLDGLSARLNGRPALITPHASEMARLLGTSVDDVLRARFEVGRDVARRLGASVLLKGVPTVISAPDGRCLVAAAGTPALAAAGSGDVLGGIALTLLAQSNDPFGSAACAAWVHGRAAEVANAGRPVRGVTLGDILAGLSHAWRQGPIPDPPVLAELPRVGDPPRAGRSS
jgi:NAD(P)H-hydrate epimerase